MNDVTPVRTLDPVTEPISPAKFAHFVLRTGQFETMANWYQTVLGARVVFCNDPGGVLQRNAVLSVV